MAAAWVIPLHPARAHRGKGSGGRYAPLRAPEELFERRRSNLFPDRLAEALVRPRGIATDLQQKVEDAAQVMSEIVGD